MTLNEYIEHLQTLVKNDPSLGDAPVMYAVDDEGNGFDEINFEPQVSLRHVGQSGFTENLYDPNDNDDDSTEYEKVILVN